MKIRNIEVLVVISTALLLTASLIPLNIDAYIRRLRGEPFKIGSYESYDIGIYYIICSNQQPNLEWRSMVQRGMEYAIPRLNTFFAQYNITWTYTTITEVKINHELRSVSFNNLPSRLDLVIDDIYEAYPTLSQDYPKYEVFIFLFAGDFSGAYSYEHRSPIYASEQMFEKESYTKTLIEHEILHTFGLPDHNRPYTKEEYGSCTMGNLNLGEIKLCPECRQTLLIPNNRYSFQELLVRAKTAKIVEPVVEEPEVAEQPEAPKNIIEVIVSSIRRFLESLFGW